MRLSKVAEARNMRAVIQMVRIISGAESRSREKEREAS